MARWMDELRGDLHERRRTSSYRSLRALDRCARVAVRDGRELINLASNDYLGLASHPALIRGATEAAQLYGTGAGSSALVAGRLEVHARIEERFARFKHAESALLTTTGYMANLAAATALAGAEDVVLLDKLCHASLIDAARLSGAQVRVYPHLNLEKLDRLLTRYAHTRRRLIVTDAVFSMDGDCADLPGLCELRDRHGAILVVDEAHATGVLGPTGAGLAELQGVAGKIDVTISTAGKALGGLGGIVTGSAVVVETLVNRARSYIYTTAPPPGQAAAIGAALDVLGAEPQLRQRLHELISRIRAALGDRGWDVNHDPTPIIPLIVGGNDAAIALANRLETAGFFAPAIRPPTVPRGASRVRISLRADLTDSDIERLVEAAGAADAADAWLSCPS